MKKIFLIIISSILLLTSVPIASAKNFNDLTSYQKQKYWTYIKDCSPLLLNKEYSKYRVCALAAFEKASQEKEENAWCTDSDGGKDYFTKGIVKTDLNPEGKEDYIKTFSNGTTYLMEGFCSSKNQYAYAQKKCFDFGKKYYAKDGACMYENKPPVLADIGDKEINEGELLAFSVSASDSDGDNLIYSVSDLPIGATFENQSFSWTPTYEQAGEYDVMFKVSDGDVESSIIVKIVVVNVCETWDKTYGGNEEDFATSIQQTSDGGYIVAGSSQLISAGGWDWDPWILKLDSSGNLEWDKTFGGSGNDIARSIQQTIDGEYIVAGSTSSKGAGEHDALVLKLDSNGDLLWDKTFGGSSPDVAVSIQQTTDGGYIVLGGTSSKGAGEHDAWVLKLDQNGILEWDKTFGGSNFDIAQSIQQTTDSGYIVAGYTPSKGAGGGDVWVFKLDSDGNLLWDKAFGGSSPDGARSIQQTTDGGYIVVGSTQSKGAGGEDVWVLKLDSNGDLEWDKTFGGSSLDLAFSVQQISDGGYIIVGKTVSKGAGGEDAWVLRLNQDGNLVWDKTFGGSEDDGASSIQQTVDGGYIVAGWTRSKGAGSFDAWIFKLDSDGNLECK